MFGNYRDLLTRCECCPRGCEADRLHGETGFCKSGADIRVSHAGLHLGEEPPISGTRGSGTIFFVSCNLRCSFCQNYQISQELGRGRGKALTVDQLVSQMLRLQAEGAHNINFVSPTHMIFQMAAAIETAEARGLSIPVVYNSNGYDSVDSLRRIRGLVDVYLPDLKYMDDELGRRLSKVDDYADTVAGVIEEMLDQVGHLVMNGEGVAVRGLLVRHLVLPGHLENSRRCLDFLAGLSRDTFVSIMSQYSPQYKAYLHPEINRTLSNDEYEEITSYALDRGLENAFVQEMESQCHYLPDFDRDRPFDSVSLATDPCASGGASGAALDAGRPGPAMGPGARAPEGAAGSSAPGPGQSVGRRRARGAARAPVPRPR
jgi:putative pyruvate formate lyase activating enzyme